MVWRSRCRRSALGDRKLPYLSGLSLAIDTLSGKWPSESVKRGPTTDDAPWADIIAMDVALDAGDLPAADTIAARWAKDGDAGALRAVRLARLARYEGHLDQADTMSQLALDHGTVTPRVLWERVFELVAREHALQHHAAALSGSTERASSPPPAR
jgi:hypothetical protein